MFIIIIIIIFIMYFLEGKGSAEEKTKAMIRAGVRVVYNPSLIGDEILKAMKDAKLIWTIEEE